MNQEVIISSRLDRELRKKIITPGDYNIVPYEDSRCKISLTEVEWANEGTRRDIEKESLVFKSTFDGNILIGDSDCFIDKDFELILQQMCCGEVCKVSMVYRNSTGIVVKEIKCKVELKEVMEEQLISEWSWERLLETAIHHKDRGVELVRDKRIADAFRRFSKALKMLVAIEPMDPEMVDKANVREMIDLKVKLYNNLAHCQLQYEEYEAALQLCNKALSYNPENVKALYRRCVAYSGMHLYEEAWSDIQCVIKLEPNDRAAQNQATALRPKVEKINKEYTNVVKRMFN